MISKNLSDDLSALERHYSSLAREFGDAPQTTQQRDRQTQETRMRRLIEIADLSTASVLDLGCGTGHLLNVLGSGYLGTYTGYDLSEEVLAIARSAHPAARFERREILTEGMADRFDYCLISGTFNNRIADNWEFLTSTLKTLRKGIERGIAFNALSTYVDYFDDHLSYLDPAKVFDFCKREISPYVTLRHDYEVRPGVVPFEFTMYIHFAPQGA